MKEMLWKQAVQILIESKIKVEQDVA